MDPIVKASAYGDKKVWSYHGSDPLPWTMFHPRDYGSAKIVFDGTDVRPVGRVPAPGVHPRIFFSPEDLPELRRRLKETRAGQEAYKNILCYANALNGTYDEKADYAKPDWLNGSFNIHGRVPLWRFGGEHPKGDPLTTFAEGKLPSYYEKEPARFFDQACMEAFRCLIDNDSKGAQKLAAATCNAVKFEQERRAREDKPVQPGQPPKVSTGRYNASNLGFVYDFIFNWLTPEQKQFIHDELVTLSAWHDNYGSFNVAEGSRSNWTTFTFWVFDLMAIEGEPGFKDLKYLALYRGYRNFYTYAFFDSGAFYEGEGKLPLGFDAAVAFDRVGWKYNLEPLTWHPTMKNFVAKFLAYDQLPVPGTGYAIFDILGGLGNGLTTPHDIVVARWLYPKDPMVDFTYGNMLGSEYKGLPNQAHCNWHQTLTTAIFATDFTPGLSAEALNIPNTFFCGQRSLLLTRSSWDTNATFFTMHVRGASGGHPYPDRNGILMAGQGRPWVTVPFTNIGGWACNTVLIDDVGQNETTPGRVVDFADTPTATFLTGDSKYCWDWVWNQIHKNRQQQPLTRADVTSNNIGCGLAWTPVEQCFNDFAWTKSSQPHYCEPLKFSPNWITPGACQAVVRQENMPVLHSFRSAGLVRGTRPYVLVVDDIEKNGFPAKSDWNLSLMSDVVRVEKPGAGLADDIILTGKKSTDTNGGILPREPALLVRILQCDGQRAPVSVGERQKWNLLTVSTRAVTPNFKVLLYAFRGGDPLPQTSWNQSHALLEIAFPDQKDTIGFTPRESGKTDLVITRGGQTILSLNKQVVPLNDPQDAALTDSLKSQAVRLASMRSTGFDPAKIPGFLIGWNFGNPASQGAFVPMAGSDTNVAAIPSDEFGLTEGANGGKAILAGSKALVGEVKLPDRLTGPFTVSLLIKTKESPTNEKIFSWGEWGGQAGIGADVHGSLRFRFFGGLEKGGSVSTDSLSSWTDLTYVYDEKSMKVYRNGHLLFDIPSEGTRPNLGKTFSIGGNDEKFSIQNLVIYGSALTADQVRDLSIWGRFF